MRTVCNTADIKQTALDVLRGVILTRLIDEKTRSLAKQNKGGTFHLCNNGHELVGVVAGTLFKESNDWGLPYYRDRGFPIGKGCPPKELIISFLAKGTDVHSGGRMMPDHYSDRMRNIPCQSSVVASQLLHAAGVAKGIRLRGSGEVVYVSVGDGGTSQGDFHETLNFATIHKLPLIVVVQDNGLAISVPQNEQTSGGNVASYGKGYEGLSVFEVDGSNYEELTAAFKDAMVRSSNGPSLIVAKVPRIGAHSSSDDPSVYLSQEDIAIARGRDPLVKMREYVVSRGWITDLEVDELTMSLKEEIDQYARDADELPNQSGLTSNDAFMPTDVVSKVEESHGDEIVMSTALNGALVEEMERDENLVVFGQDVARGKGGVFKVTSGLTEKFGEDRCFNTPLAESLIMGISLGLTLDGIHSCVAEIQFADYIWTGVNQLFNEISSFYFRSNGMWNIPIVIRMPCGGYIQGGPYHSQSIEGVLAHIPGLKVVYPSNAADAKMLLKGAIRDPNPVIFLEHKGLYRQRAFAARSEPSRESVLELGLANVVLEGIGMTIIAWGMMVPMAVDIVKELGLSIEVIDLRTIVPFDKETVLKSVRKTGKALIIQEAPLECGFGSEVAAVIAEEAFEYLDGPIKRIGALMLPVPYCKELEDEVLPSREGITKAITALYHF